MMAVMSANGNPQQANDSGIYNFEMDNAIPAYLLAIAVGDIRFKPVSYTHLDVYKRQTILHPFYGKPKRNYPRNGKINC